MTCAYKTQVRHSVRHEQSALNSTVTTQRLFWQWILTVEYFRVLEEKKKKSESSTITLLPGQSRSASTNAHSFLSSFQCSTNKFPSPTLNCLWPLQSNLKMPIPNLKNNNHHNTTKVPHEYKATTHTYTHTLDNACTHTLVSTHHMQQVSEPFLFKMTKKKKQFFFLSSLRNNQRGTSLHHLYHPTNDPPIFSDKPIKISCKT